MEKKQKKAAPKAAKKAAPKAAKRTKKTPPKKAVKKEFNFKEWLPWVMMGIVALILLLVLLGQNGGNSDPNKTRTDVPTVQEQPRTAEVQVGNVVFCFRLDGREDRHLPDLVPGITGAIPNNVAGSNFSLPVTNDLSLPYGVTDEYVFVKSSYLEQFNYSFVEIKAGWTGWAPKPGELIQINDERVYIFRFHSLR